MFFINPAKRGQTRSSQLQVSNVTIVLIIAIFFLAEYDFHIISRVFKTAPLLEAPAAHSAVNVTNGEQPADAAAAAEAAAAAAAAAVAAAAAPPPAPPPPPSRFDSDVEASARRSRPMPDCVNEQPRAKSFMFVFMGHSGSTAILSELQQHPEISVKEPEPLDHREEEKNTTAALITAERIFSEAIKDGKIPGFKVRPMHLRRQPELFRKLIAKYGTRIIWQHRHNIFKSAVGEYSYRFLNDTSSVEGLRSAKERKERCSVGAGCSFPVKNFDYFHAILSESMKSNNVIADAVNTVTSETKCVREMRYEDYLYNREDAMRDIYKFLGLPAHVKPPQRFKATSDNLCEVVENWEEVCRNFYGCTMWQHMMDDARNKCFCNFTSGPIEYCMLRSESNLDVLKAQGMEKDEAK